MTKDERLLLELYKLKTATPETLQKALNLSEHLVRNILRGLSRANFVVHKGGGVIAITPQGIELAESLLSKGR